jgi:hypothetical protein
MKKLGLTHEEFIEIWKRPNKSFLDYPSYYPGIRKFLRIVKYLFKFFLPAKPMIFFEIDERQG